MVQSAENWADIRGQVVRLHGLPNTDSFVEAEIQVRDVKDVLGFANLFAWSPGQCVRVRILRDQASALDLKAGQTIECRVQKLGPQLVYAHTNHIKPRKESE